jgi:hypothetical protein
LKTLRFSLAGNKASVLEQLCTYIPYLFCSMYKLHDRSNLARTYARELLESLIDYSLVNLRVEWSGVFG